MRPLFLFLCACLALGGWQGATAGEPAASQGYSLWSKERIRYFHNKVQLNPYDAQLRVLLGNAYYADGQIAKAREELQRAVELQPKLAAGHCNLAVVLHAQSQLAQARVHYEEALRLDSTLVEARVGLGTLLCRMDQLVQGLAQLERALEWDPARLAVRYNLAVGYYQAGDFHKAITHLEILLQSDSTYAGAGQALARAYYQQGVACLQAQQAQQALEFFDKSLRYSAGDEELFFAKGLAHLEQKEYVPAEAAFKEAVRLEEAYLPALQHLAVLCEQTQRPQEAEYYYRQAQKWAARWPMIQAARHARLEIGQPVK